MTNSDSRIAVVRVRNILMVTMPPDPEDSTVANLQERVLSEMERYQSKGLILDISAVDTLDSFFARTLTETAKMVTLLGGQTVIAGMRPQVAMASVELGLSLDHVVSTLTVDRALDWYEVRNGIEADL